MRQIQPWEYGSKTTVLPHMLSRNKKYLKGVILNYLQLKGLSRCRQRSQALNVGVGECKDKYGVFILISRVVLRSSHDTYTHTSTIIKDTFKCESSSA
jgi:hypothetical protein